MEPVPQGGCGVEGLLSDDLRIEGGQPVILHQDPAPSDGVSHRRSRAAVDQVGKDILRRDGSGRRGVEDTEIGRGSRLKSTEEGLIEEATRHLRVDTEEIGDNSETEARVPPTTPETEKCGAQGTEHCGRHPVRAQTDPTTVVRGTLDCLGIESRRRGRSKYGTKTPKAAK